MQQAPDVDLRISELQTQIDKLALALNRSAQTTEDEYLHPTGERLSQLLERCAETLSRVAAIDERQTKAIAKLEARLSDWGFIESRLEQDSDQRIRQFEQIIEREWEALRKLHEEPARQLREQAASLGETCVAAANLALRGFERAEARFAALEAGLQGRISQLAGELQVALAELRGGSDARTTSLATAVSPFPLESVMRIHDELRRSEDQHDRSSRAAQIPSPGQNASSTPAKTSLQLPDAASRPSAPAPSLEREAASASDRAAAAPPRATLRWWTSRPGIVVLVLGLVGASVLVFWLQRRVEAKLDEAAQRVSAAERQAATATELANRRIAETREDADTRLAEAREGAVRTQIMTSVLAAPDLIRFNLSAGPGAPRANAQVLWSRSHGLVLTASRLPAPQRGTTYQLWLMTSTGPVSAGVFVPDAAGRATLATDDPPRVPRPVVSAAVTLEPVGGSQQPTGDPVLTRVQ